MHHGAEPDWDATNPKFTLGVEELKATKLYNGARTVEELVFKLKLLEQGKEQTDGKNAIQVKKQCIVVRK